MSVRSGSTLRMTESYIATKSPRGVRISALDRGVYPKSRVVSMPIWRQLDRMNDSEFDGSIVLELGIGSWTRKGRRTYSSNPKKFDWTMTRISTSIYRPWANQAKDLLDDYGMYAEVRKRGMNRYDILVPKWLAIQSKRVLKAKYR